MDIYNILFSTYANYKIRIFKKKIETSYLILTNKFIKSTTNLNTFIYIHIFDITPQHIQHTYVNKKYKNKINSFSFIFI